MCFAFNGAGNVSNSIDRLNLLNLRNRASEDTMTTKNVSKTGLPSPSDVAGQVQAAQQLNNNRLLLTLWFVVESILFFSLVYANFSVRFAQSQWPPEGVNRLSMAFPLVLTAILLISSFAAMQANAAIKRNDRPAVTRFMGLTVLLGVLFVAGVFVLLSSIPFRGPYNAMFIALWAVHVAHAIAGVLFLGYVLRRVARGQFTAESHYPLEASISFWHFLDIMWIILFVILYVV